MDKHLVVIAGPTATGKTALSIRLAEEFDLVILSADARQFYREMHIGTAIPSVEELYKVPHFFIGSHTILHPLSSGKYESEALELLEKLYQKRNIVLMTGGSGLYIKAVCEGFDAMPEPVPGVREELVSIYEREGVGELQKLLKKHDPDYLKQVDISNPQRIIRALEVTISSGKPYSSLRHGRKQTRPFKVLKIGLDLDRESLYKKIDRRVDEMMENGLLDEVRTLLPYRHSPALNTLGYSELFDYLDGKCTLEAAVDLIKRNTRRYAKRQLTWFRKDPEFTWYHPDEYDAIAEKIRIQVNHIDT